MRKMFFLFLFLCLSFSSLYSFQGNAPLCRCIIQHCADLDSCSASYYRSGSCSVTNPLSIKNLDCSKSGDGFGITKLDGIRFLKKLTLLNVGFNKSLSSLDPIIHLSSLEQLHANNTAITTIPKLPVSIRVLDLPANLKLKNLDNLTSDTNFRLRSINFNGNKVITNINKIVEMEKRNVGWSKKYNLKDRTWGLGLYYLDLDDIYNFHEDKWLKKYETTSEVPSSDLKAKNLFQLNSWLEDYEQKSRYNDLETGLIYDTGFVNNSTPSLVTVNMNYWLNQAFELKRFRERQNVIVYSWRYSIDDELLENPFLKKLKNRVIGYTCGKRRSKCAEFGSITNYQTLLNYTVTHPKYSRLRNILLQSYQYRRVINEIIVSFKSFIRNIDPVSQRPSDFRVSPRNYITLEVQNLLVDLSDSCVLGKYVNRHFRAKGIIGFEDFINYLFKTNMPSEQNIKTLMKRPGFFFKATRYFNELREVRDEYEAGPPPPVI